MLLNFLLSSNSLMLDLHSSCPFINNVCLNCSIFYLASWVSLKPFIILYVISVSHENVLSSISNFCSSWYLSVTFQSFCCLSVGLPVLGITCTDLAVFTGLSASLTGIVAALAVCWLPYQALFSHFLLTSAFCECVFFSYFLVCFLWDFLSLAFYFWHHVMLLALNGDNTTGSFYPFCLLHVLSMITESAALCKSMDLYTIIICTDGVLVCMCPWMPLVTTGIICYWLHVCRLRYAYILDASKLWINIILLFVFHNITTQIFSSYVLN